MIISAGKNNYPNNEFSFWEWSAPILQTYEEVMSAIRKMKLKDRVIKGFCSVGMGYNWRDDDIGEAIYCTLEEMIKEKRISPEGPFPFLPEGVYISRFAMIDEPFLIEFEDGDILAVDYSEGSRVRMELNTIPQNINCGANVQTFHPDVLFNSLIGKKIIAVEVTASTEPYEFSRPYGFDISEHNAYISKIAFVCQCDKEWELEKLEFSYFIDCGIVAVTDGKGEHRKIHAPEIKEVVEGFIDEETLNLSDDYHFDIDKLCSGG